MAIACLKGDSCRIWNVPPSAMPDSPMVVARGCLPICSIVDVSDRWLLARDRDACAADTGDSPLPLRAISLVDGSTRLLHASPNLLPSRLAEVDGRTLALASTRSRDWTTSDIVSIDVETGDRRTLLSGLPNDNDGGSGWYGVDRQRIVDPWVLVQMWGVERTPDTEPPPAKVAQRIDRAGDRPFARDVWVGLIDDGVSGPANARRGIATPRARRVHGRTCADVVKPDAA